MSQVQTKVVSKNMNNINEERISRANFKATYGQVKSLELIATNLRSTRTWIKLLL